MRETSQNRIEALLASLYGADVGQLTSQRLLTMLQAYAIRCPQHSPARPADERLTADDIILITYGDQFRKPDHTPLQSLASALDGPFAAIVSGVHLLPFYPYTSDDGFSVVDYTAVDPALGTWDDIEALRARYRLMFDAVVNHISASSTWFRDLLAGVPGAEERFLSLDPNTDLRQVTRPRVSPLLTPFKTPTGVRHIWTTFSADQIDLNFANPELLLEMTAVLLEYVAKGASLIRLDAIGYLWKEVGTRCIHLPQTHQVVQLWRAILDHVAPDVLLITETNVPHADNVSYFGDGSNEAQLVYQFPLAPLVLHSFATGDARQLSGWAAGLSLPSSTTTFFNFLASHDGIGVVPATGILSQAEIGALCGQIESHGGRVSYKSNPDGSQSPYEINSTWFDALSDPASDEPMTRKIDRFIASQAIMLALQGVPGVYIHSLVGSGNYHPGLQASGIHRRLNREKWDLAELTARLADPTRREGTVLARMAHLIRTRRAAPAFHPNGSQQIHDLDPAIFAVERHAPDGSQRILCLHNVSATTRQITLPTGTTCTLEPYQVRWLTVS
ncbi:sugar phosphorylase [Candidatus Chloroploca asiatica]|uniref:sugar phosphorylase n=1 Tax=Candidatus Chloroploca asiatica TaxID=1506545 RepID=UPI001C0F100F|nr:sugar phosphorylase [Candidatus Chloroploca asiatica]